MCVLHGNVVWLYSHTVVKINKTWWFGDVPLATREHFPPENATRDPDVRVFSLQSNVVVEKLADRNHDTDQANDKSRDSAGSPGVAGGR